MIDELKPCPLCGYNNLHFYGYDNPNCCWNEYDRMIWVIKCGTCNLTLANYDKDRLKEIWNGRINEVTECKCK